MNQYLLQILKETNTIIIPGLGALTITNPTTGEIMFMPFLKHDDGKLSEYIADKEGIEENEAKNIISKYVREINSTLDKGESYDMFEFGIFSKGADGDIEFETWSKEHNAKPAVEEKKDKIPEKSPKKEEPKTEVPKEEHVEKTGPKEEPKRETPKPVVEVAKKEDKPKAEEIKKPEAPAPETKKVETDKSEVTKETPKESVQKTETKKEAPIVPITAKKDMNIAQKEELKANEAKLKKLKDDKEALKVKKKRGIGFYLLMVLIVLIIGGGTTVAIFYDDVKQHIPFLSEEKQKETSDKEIEKMKDMIGDEEVNTDEQNTDESSEELMSEEVLVSEEDEIVEPIVEEEPEPTPPPANNGSNNLPFHIVAGAFGDQNNAERLAEKIRGMGYPAKTFLRGSMTIVSVKSFATKAEAQAAVSSVQDAAPNGWVLEWRN